MKKLGKAQVVSATAHGIDLSLPDGATRKALLEVLLRDVPAQELALDQIADRTPGFVRADLAALVREAALRAAARASDDGEPPALTQEDFTGALTVILPELSIACAVST